MRAGYLLAFALAVAACSDSPANPAMPLLMTPQTVAVRVEGKVIDADSGEGIPGAAVAFHGGNASGPRITKADTISPVGFTDESGSFVLEWMLPARWTELRIDVERENFLGTGHHFWFLGSITDAVVRLYPEITIRPGESLDTHVSLGSYGCGDEIGRCRKIYVDVSGGPVDVELIPLDGQGPNDAGLAVAPFIPTLPPARWLRVTHPDIFIYGSGRVQLRASRSAQ